MSFTTQQRSDRLCIRNNRIARTQTPSFSTPKFHVTSTTRDKQEVVIEKSSKHDWVFVACTRKSFESPPVSGVNRSKIYMAMIATDLCSMLEAYHPSRYQWSCATLQWYDQHPDQQ